MTARVISRTMIGLAVCGVALAACSKSEKSDETPAAVADETAVEVAADAADRAVVAPGHPVDRFSNSNPQSIRVTHLDLDLDILFDEKVLDGVVVLDVDYVDPQARTLILDTDDLTIRSVEAGSDGAFTAADYSLGEDDERLGAPLTITMPEGATQVRISYRTSPGAAGLQWLTLEQTAGKEHPFMYSQAQALHARSMTPLQDTPASRITYSATLRTPPELIALMSASQDPDGVRDGEYTFDMPQAVPSYLLAIAAGDIEFKAISDTIGVYAESYILDAAAKEFEDTPLMEEANVALYGPYRWGRYDMIVLPPSFPFGGMENPRLSFLTPTLVAGDKSLTNVVAHELAHSWSGNLVTNSTWEDAWLNEGFTSYVENRVMEALYGERRATMERALDFQSLKRDIADAERPELTALKMPADLGDPDDAFSQVSYAGGMFFLKFLEERFGRDDFDAFLRGYFDHFAFKSLTTEEFLDYFKENLMEKNPDAVTMEEINEWVYEPGLAPTAKEPVSDAFSTVEGQLTAWLDGAALGEAVASDEWSTHEWLHFLNSLPDDLTTEQFAELDAAFGLSESQNAETAFAWYMNTIKGDYAPAMPALEGFLKRVGRGKFIYRLYAALEETEHRDWALGIYEQARPGYHPIAQRRIDAIFE